MTRTPVTVSAVDAASLATLYIAAGVKRMVEDQTVLNEGYAVSYIGPLEEGGPVFALVKAPSDEAYAEIDKTFGENVNVTNAPVRVFLGDAMPEQGITRRQLRDALDELGILKAVESAVADSPAKVQIWYADSDNFLKSDPMVQGMAAQLGVTAEQLDAIWALGATK